MPVCGEHGFQGDMIICHDLLQLNNFRINIINKELLVRGYHDSTRVTGVNCHGSVGYGVDDKVGVIIV